jgi:tetratricopeptide (TPR) repeat protein
MRKLVLALATAAAFSSSVHAADKPVIGPAPGWVKPVALPPPSLKADQAAVRVLLSDQQVFLEKGRQTLYYEVAFKIQTPQGLAAGATSFAWEPDTQAVTVHKLLIRRGDQVIDVLASGQTFTVVRREQNLESATLDGVLTANLQPEGLRVGDIVDFAASVTTSDPLLKGHVEQISAAWNGLSISRAHLRMQWPADVSANLRTAGPLPALKPVKANGVTSVELSLDNVEPISSPKGAPPRYAIGRRVELTDFASWGDLSALMAPLYQEAAVLPAQGPLRMELERIRGLSPDPKTRAEAALTLVQDRIRYVALEMGAGGLAPAKAETTWSRRYGDCKGKTALLLALLKELDISAVPVLVNTDSGDGLDERLPMIGLFNHVLVRAIVAGKIYWLDGVRTGDTSLDRLTTPAFGWGLPVQPRGAALVRMLPNPLETPTQSVTIRIDASAGLRAPAPATAETILRGDEATGLNITLANLSSDARDRALRDYWKKQYDSIDIKSIGAAFDPKTGEERLTMEGAAKMDWAEGTYNADGAAVGYRADFSRDLGSGGDAPFAVPYPYFTRMWETILLPKGYGDFKLGAGMEVDQTAGGIQYRRHATISGDVFTIEKTERSIAPEFAAKDAPAAQAALRALMDRTASLRQPPGYRSTDKDIAAARGDTPKTADNYVDRAAIFMERGLRKEALLDLDKALELDPGDVLGWSNRAFTRVLTGDLAGAKTDLDKAESLDPGFVQNFIGRGLLADAENRPLDAIAAYTKALQLEPKNGRALRLRAAAYAALRDGEHAVADRTAAIAVSPDDSSAYLDRGNLFLHLKRFDEAIKDFDHALSLDPQGVRALADRGLTYALKGSLEMAARDLDAANAIDPKSAAVFRARGVIAQQKGASRDAVSAYTTALEFEPNNSFATGNRAAALHDIGDNDGALRDSAAALKQAPGWIDLYLLRANIFLRQAKPTDALAEAIAVETANPDVSYAHVVAASIYSGLHKDAEAMRAYDRAIAIKPEAYIYLNRSQRRPNTDWAGRLSDIDAALALDPKYAEAIVAKAGWQREAGDLAGAIATYTSALQIKPDIGSAMTGRAEASLTIGDYEAALQDSTAALKKNPAWIDGYLLRANIFRMQGKPDEALAQAVAVTSANPTNISAYVTAAMIYSSYHKNAEAMRAYDRAIAIKSEASVYLERSSSRPKSDMKGRWADIDAALRLNPMSSEVISAKGRVASRERRSRGCDRDLRQSTGGLARKSRHSSRPGHRLYTNWRQGSGGNRLRGSAGRRHRAGRFEHPLLVKGYGRRRPRVGAD